jgi:hypothetical protein
MTHGKPPLSPLEQPQSDQAAMRRYPAASCRHRRRQGPPGNASIRVLQQKCLVQAGCCGVLHLKARVIPE